MDISECSLIGWKIWQIFSLTRFLYNNLLRIQTAIILEKILLFGFNVVDLQI